MFLFDYADYNSKEKFKVDQNNYNNLFCALKINQMGFGDVSVNKKMKELNKLFYDTILKININNEEFN